jgi:hypothetical protein
MKSVASITVLMALVLPARGAQTCTSAEARAFDFWLGNWNIEQRILQQDGTWLSLGAETTVSQALDGCALVEHWRGDVQFFWQGMDTVKPMQGLSVRAHNPSTGKWYIHWMDTFNPQFGEPYSGGFTEGRGEFFRNWSTPQGARTGRITFSDITRDSVHWELATSSDDGASWTTLWVMAMTRRENGTSAESGPGQSGD